MIPCNEEHENKWWMSILCLFGIHWHGRRDGGTFGDAFQCHVCGRDDYSSLGIIVYREDKS